MPQGFSFFTAVKIVQQTNMTSLFAVITLFMGLSMFFLSRDKKISLIFISCMTMTLLRLDFPFLKTTHMFLVVFFLISELKYFSNILYATTKSPINYLLLSVVLSSLVAILFSPHLQSLKEALDYIKNELFFKYFIIIYAFYAIKNKRDWENLIKMSIIPMFILTLLGIVNLIEGRSSFVTEMMSNWVNMNSSQELAGDRFEGEDRFRVQAMFYNPFDYGYICMILLFLYIFNRKVLGKYLSAILISCSLFGIFMCGCRTVIFCAISCLCVYLLLSVKTRKVYQIGIISIFLTIIAYQTIPVVNEKLDEMTTIFTDKKGNKIGGSNIEMRTIQTATVLMYIEESPFVGRGVHFFNIDMGWNQGRNGLKDLRLEGIEGVYMLYLLERGIIGYSIYLFFWFSILIFFIRHRASSSYYSTCGIVIWSVYSLFANMTGELLSVTPTLIVLGGLISICQKSDSIVNSKKRNIYF